MLFRNAKKVLRSKFFSKLLKVSTSLQNISTMVFQILVASLEFDLKDRNYKIVHEVKFLSFSHNWNDFKNWWCLRYNFYNLKVSDALKILKGVFEKMDDEKIVIGVPDEKNPSWEWGVKMENNKTVKLPTNERLSIFRYNLDQLRKQLSSFEKSEEHYVLDPDNPGKISVNGVKYHYFSEDPDDSNDSDPDKDHSGIESKSPNNDDGEKATENCSASDADEAEDGAEKDDQSQDSNSQGIKNTDTNGNNEEEDDSKSKNDSSDDEKKPTVPVPVQQPSQQPEVRQ